MFIRVYAHVYNIAIVILIYLLNDNKCYLKHHSLEISLYNSNNNTNKNKNDFKNYFISTTKLRYNSCEKTDF